MPKSGVIRVGIGGWTYEPWRETFYPADLPKKSELHYASRQVTAIEINGTFYRLQTPAVFAKWRDETPDTFVFTIKAPRYIVQRRNLAENAESLQKFLGSGLVELGSKLGPILWQLAPTKKFDSMELTQFFALLPATLSDLPLRHALEVRHASFASEEYLDLARKHRITTVYTHSAEYPGIADLTGEFVYARLRSCVSSEPTGYPTNELKSWATRTKEWAEGGMPALLPAITERESPRIPRDVYLFFINGAKERAPAAARHLLSLL